MKFLSLVEQSLLAQTGFALQIFGNGDRFLVSGRAHCVQIAVLYKCTTVARSRQYIGESASSESCVRAAMCNAAHIEKAIRKCLIVAYRILAFSACDGHPSNGDCWTC